MILTGHEIEAEVGRNRITIKPFNPELIEPNSYGFRLSSKLLTRSTMNVWDSRKSTEMAKTIIPDSGYLLEPGRLYLSSTVEMMGSMHYAKSIYADRSIATLGMWIHFSAPLGHVGAIIPWTLEIQVAHPLMVYPEMKVGKIAFWETNGEIDLYDGKYSGASCVEASKFSRESGDSSHSTRGGDQDEYN